MAIYEVETDVIMPVAEARFADLGLKERGDLQRLLRDRVEVVAPDAKVWRRSSSAGRTAAAASICSRSIGMPTWSSSS